MSDIDEVLGAVRMQPAAGTGSGEAPECARCNRPAGAFRRDCHMCGAPLCDTACEEWHIEKDCPVTHDATPPASPTVTLDRIDHAFESAISALAWLPQDGPIRKRTAEVVDELRAARQELALLRAAERQK